MIKTNGINKTKYWWGILYPENFVENWQDEISDMLCDRALYTVACKAALKAGIKNRPEDDENVVRMLADNPSLRFCPHGRPFIKKIPKREIEKFFDR